MVYVSMTAYYVLVAITALFAMMLPGGEPFAWFTGFLAATAAWMTWTGAGRRFAEKLGAAL